MEKIHAVAELTITAAKGRAPQAFIEAYNGGELKIGARNYVIDLDTLHIPASVPLLADHNNTLAAVIGSATAKAQHGKLTASGVLAPEQPAAQQVIALAKAGVPLQASVGVTFSGPVFTRKGETITANGRTFTASTDLSLVRDGHLLEISAVALGADSTTSITVAAKRSQTMSDTTTTPDDAISAANTAERAAGIVKIVTAYRAGTTPGHDGGILARLDELEERAISDPTMDLNRVALEALRAARPTLTFNPGTYARTASANPSQTLTAAMMLHSGRADLATKVYGERVSQQAQDLRCNSLVDICAAALRSEMRDVPRDRNEMIRAAVSTSSLPVALSSYAEKTAAEAFAETPGIWRQLAKRKSVTTFHSHKVVRVLLVGNLQSLPPAGHIEHGTRSETVKEVQAGTKALMLGIDRRHVIDDDLSTFTETAASLAMAAARTMNDDFANTILANGGDFFSSGNGNHAEGVTAGTNDTRLNAEGLQRALQAMAKRTDAAGRIIDVRAAFLVVPPELEFVADQLLSSAEVMRYAAAGTDNQPTGNPFQKLLTRLTEPRLSSTAYDGSSATTWYVFATPMAGAINAALLGGRDTPVVESEPAPFNQLGLQFRSYIDYGFGLGEPVAAQRMKGAA